MNSSVIPAKAGIQRVERGLRLLAMKPQFTPPHPDFPIQGKGFCKGPPPQGEQPVWYSLPKSTTDLLIPERILHSYNGTASGPP